jgi:hypothetical protein
MANSLITHLEYTRQFLAEMLSSLKIAKSMNRSYDARWKQGGYDGQKIGPTLQIRKPNQFTVRTGWPIGVQDVTEKTVPLTIDTVKGIDLAFTDEEQVTTIDDYRQRYVIPPARRLAAEVDKICGAFIKNHTPKIAGTAGTQPNTSAIVLDCTRKVYEGNAPLDGNLTGIICPATSASLVGALAGQHNPTGMISSMFEKGQITSALGVDFFMSQVLTAHTCGSRDDTSPVAAAAPVVSAGIAALVVTAADTAATWTEGDIITVADCYEVNPETKQTLSYLKQFRVTAAATCSGGACTLYVSPGPITSGAYQNCSAFPGGAIVNVGTASYTYSNDLIFHKDAFTLATIDLEKPEGVIAETVSAEGISIRFLRQYDIKTPQMISRMDVFFGIAELAPEWSCRMIGAGA